MSDRNKIIKFCEDYLEVKNFSDYCHNGLQVEGMDEISKIITGVSLSQKLIEAAIQKKAQMIMVHHGIFKSSVSEPPRFSGSLKNRLKLLLQNNINLAGFHLPLDAHPVIGNNISLIKVLGLKNIGVLSSLHHEPIGFLGGYQKGISFNQFVDLVNKKLNTKSYVIASGLKTIKKVGIISGGASPDYICAKQMGADTYLCGDIHEFLVREIEEEGMNFINAGHYNTEKMGIQNLGNLVARKFKVEVEFVDVPCEI
ncbi:MAG: Nif3-like dinuclear metal center hexameric protein [Patescibacteria group bacterium]|nr:Nif3-like dinuclear metal center hexameric protein [Patescibacteria group bacterium]MDD4610895.1 Nif3-like dinuclear metal center hexameric protein [Patescibacteria group bacterium]